MITAVDTNILLDILVPNIRFYDTSADALEEAVSRGSIVISDIVYAEFCIHFEDQKISATVTRFSQAMKFACRR